MSEALDDVIVSTQLVPLSQAVEVNPKIDRTALHDDLEVTFVPMAAVKALSGDIDVSNIRKYAEVKKGYTHFRNGDILFAKVTPCMENGKMAIARKLLNGVGFGSTEFHVLRPRAGVDARYIYYFVSSQTFRKEASGHMTGAVGLRRVPSAYLEEQLISLPSIEQQREIVAEIEKQFSRLDEAVANLQRVKANLKRYKASVLKDAVEGRLVPTEAELARREGRSFETGEQLLQRILEARQQKWDGKGKYKDATPAAETLGLIVPDGWLIASAEQACSSVRDGTHSTPDYVASGVPLITSKNLEEHGLDFENVKFISEQDHIEISKRSDVLLHDILFAMIGTIGNPCEVKTEAKFSIKNVALFKANDEYLQPTYFCYWLQSAPFKKWLGPRLKGTTQKFAPLGLLRELPMLLPPFEEQVRIVAEVDRHLSIIREVEAEVDANLKRAQSLRQATLKQAFEV